MKLNQTVTIQVEAESDIKKWNRERTFVTGQVVNVKQNSIQVQVDTSSLRGFNDTTIMIFTLRKDGSWCRIGCGLGRGWMITN